MENLEKKIEWKTSNGQRVTACCSLTFSERINLDGDICYVTACDYDFQIKIDDHYLSGSLCSQKRRINGIEYVANYGQLCISAKNFEKINKMILEVKSHPKYLEKMEIDKKVEEDYQEHYKMMEREMQE